MIGNFARSLIVDKYILSFSVVPAVSFNEIFVSFKGLNAIKADVREDNTPIG